MPLRAPWTAVDGLHPLATRLSLWFQTAFIACQSGPLTTANARHIGLYIGLLLTARKTVPHPGSQKEQTCIDPDPACNPRPHGSVK